MKKPTKKQGIILAGVAVIIVCAAGWIALDHSDEEKIPMTNAVVVHDVKPIIDKAMKQKEQEEKEQQEKKEKEEKQKEEAKKQQEEAQKEVVQSIVPEPEVPQEETVQAPPVQAPSEPAGDNGDSGSHDGMIWIDGFGWIKDEGGGGEVIEAPDMVPNGNQIGEMN